eukprot:TRINITY_DN7403_c0_g1_i1.p1 TRINITY_DN7403_c0_g1~~TRINITY_DN7403_c0_g1_i1.p1  ORF type:complete len:170 (+),score=19.65 TRINITY_DN7403_c0_g1_i1:46-555(+)
MRYNGPKRRKVFAGIQIVKNDRILLGMKRRGTGKGLWQHAFAGKVENNESIQDAALRELHEETSLTATPDQLQYVGLFEYEFTNPALVPFVMEVHIYRALSWSGHPKTSSEIRPKWFQITDIPFEDMWPDNSFWLQRSIQGENLYGYFLYEDWNTISSYHIEKLTDSPP